MLTLVLAYANITAIIIVLDISKLYIILFQISICLGSFVAHRIKVSTHSTKVTIIFRFGVA